VSVPVACTITSLGYYTSSRCLFLGAVVSLRLYVPLVFSWVLRCDNIRIGSIHRCPMLGIVHQQRFWTAGRGKLCMGCFVSAIAYIKIPQVVLRLYVPLVFSWVLRCDSIQLGSIHRCPMLDVVHQRRFWTAGRGKLCMPCFVSAVACVQIPQVVRGSVVRCILDRCIICVFIPSE